MGAYSSGEFSIMFYRVFVGRVFDGVLACICRKSFRPRAVCVFPEGFRYRVFFPSEEFPTACSVCFRGNLGTVFATVGRVLTK